MRMIGSPQVYDWDSPEDQRVADPLSADLERLFQETAKTNEEALETVFHCVPTNKVRNWKDYEAWMPKPPIKTGHVAALDMNVDQVKQTLARVRGSLVPYPREFLEDVNMVCRAIRGRTVDVRAGRTQRGRQLGHVRRGDAGRRC